MSRRRARKPCSPRIEKLLAEHADQLDPRRINIARIFHDKTCSIWKGGDCDCDPTIEVVLAESHEGALREIVRPPDPEKGGGE